MTGILHLFNFKAISNIRKTWIKFAIFLISFFGVTAAGSAQNISGQWIGNFTSEEDPEGNGTDYVLEIEANGNQLSGYSYTYFSIAGKRYFVICRLKGTYDKGSKSIDIKEIETVKTNTPPDFENCHQWHQLTYLKQKDKEMLVGKWKPYEKESTCGKGFTSLERKALVRENTKPTTDKITPAPKTPTKTNPSTPKTPKPQNPILSLNIKRFQSFLFSCSKSFLYLVPVNYLPHFLQECWTHVLVVQVVCVLPNIYSKKRN